MLVSVSDLKEHRYKYKVDSGGNFYGSRIFLKRKLIHCDNGKG